MLLTAASMRNWYKTGFEYSLSDKEGNDKTWNNRYAWSSTHMDAFHIDSSLPSTPTTPTTQCWRLSIMGLH